MKSFVVFLLVAFLAVTIKAEDDYITCARDKFSVIFENLTFIDNEMKCITDYFSSDVDDDLGIEKIATKVVQLTYFNTNAARGFFDKTPDSVEKYDHLYKMADQIVFMSTNLVGEVKKLGDAGEVLQTCISTEVQRVVLAFKDAETCKPGNV